MLINADAKQLEWRCVVHLSGDALGIREIEEGRDFHSDNQRTFKLPDRGVSKIFLFRAIYKGSAYAYASDPLFSYIGGEKFWQRVIDRFYEKYEGIYNFHNRILQEVVDTGKLVMPTGRVYEFEQKQRRGEWIWPETDICNYPVQGFAADLMAITRVNLRTLLRALDGSRILPCNTVHDSIVLDVDNDREVWYNTCTTIKQAFKNTAGNYETLFKQPLLVPMDCDIKVGINWLNMHLIKI